MAIAPVICNIITIYHNGRMKMLQMSPNESSFLVRICIITGLFFCALTNIGVAQQTDFDQLLIGINASESVSNNQFTDRWDPSTGIELSLQTPFLSGRLEGGIRYIRFSNSDDFPSYSDFHSTYIHLGWGYLFELDTHIKLGPVLRIGNHHMYYDNPMVYSRPNGFEYQFDNNESEFAYEFQLRSEFPITNRWKIQANLAYNRTLTNYPLQQTFISVGFYYSFKTSSWFKDILK